MSTPGLGKHLRQDGHPLSARFRYSEVIVGIQKAIQYATPERHSDIRAKAAAQINSLSTAIYNSSREHFLTFVSLNNSWTEYLERCELILQSMVFAHELDPSHTGIIANTITLCQQCIEGIAYNDEFDNYMKKTWHVSEAYEQRLRQVMDEFVATMKSIDPTYHAPTIQKASACFVVTATLGDSNHPDCIVLRSFRDETLRHCLVGRGAICAYELIGPHLASVIASSRLLRKLSHLFVVRPMVWLCRNLGRKHRR